MRSILLIPAAVAVCVAALAMPADAQAQHCGVGGFGVQSFGFQQPVFVNQFGVHPQFQRNGFVGVSAVPIQSFAAPVFVNRGGFNRGFNVNVNSRRGFFRRPTRTNVSVNRFGQLNVNVR